MILLLLACGEDVRRPDEVSPLDALADRPAATVVEEDDAWSVSEGKRLYSWYNCSGCHSSGGGGGMGPALIDSEWRYGSSVQDIHETIVHGRPNGMPAFEGRIPDHQVWQIAAYVRSMSGLVFTGDATGRSDAMQHRVPEARMREPYEPWSKERAP
jgi:cytochrome c oxidase cbb3-type subunit 3